MLLGCCFVAFLNGNFVQRGVGKAGLAGVFIRAVMAKIAMYSCVHIHAPFSKRMVGTEYPFFVFCTF